MYQLSSFRLIACELIMACLFIVSAQVMMLVYGTWTTDMPRSKKILQSDGRIIYTYELKHTSSDSCIYPANISPYHHMTIHTHNHALTYTHTYMYTDTHNMNTAHIHHHNITYQNITWRIITSRHMQQDQYIYVCIHLHYYHPTSHHTKIISPHTHLHIRITSACTFIYYQLPLTPGTHIVNTLPKWHTCTCTYIHTYTQTHPPSPLHHSHTSSSLVAFLCSV